MGLIKRDTAITQIAEFLEALAAHTVALIFSDILESPDCDDDEGFFIDYRVRIFQNTIHFHVGDSQINTDHRGHIVSGSLNLENDNEFDDFTQYAIQCVDELEELGVVWDG